MALALKSAIVALIGGRLVVELDGNVYAMGTGEAVLAVGLETVELGIAVVVLVTVDEEEGDGTLVIKEPGKMAFVSSSTAEAFMARPGAGAVTGTRKELL